MSTFLHPGAVYRSQFHKLAIRQQFSFVPGQGPPGVWVKTGTQRYALPTGDRDRGKGYQCTNTGRVKFWVGATSTASAGAGVQLIYPFYVATEDMMRDW